jgi:murein L,D-transpeptidase YafK
MKRIPQNMAVQTLSYVLRPDEFIKVIDYPNIYDCSEGRNGTVVFEGVVGALNSWEYAKICASKIHEVFPVTDILVLKIVTNADRY